MAGVMQLSLIKSQSLTPWQERHNELLAVENDIRKDLAKMQECCVFIGYHLLDIERQRLYDVVMQESRCDYCKNIYEYALQELDLSKTTTFNLMAVAKAFSNDCRGLKEEYKGYSFSQLVELLSFPKEFLPYAHPSMSVKDLRLLKKGKQVSYTGDDGIWKACSISVEVFQAVKKNESSVLTVAAETVEPVQALPESENHSDVGTEEATQALPESENHSDVGTPAEIASIPHEPQDTSGMVYLHFTCMDELRNWFFSDNRKNVPFPLTIAYKE